MFYLQSLAFGLTLQIRYKNMIVPRIQLRQNAVKKDGTAPIVLNLIFNGNTRLISIGISIAPEYFDEQSGQVKKAYKAAKEMNLIIDNAKARATDIITRFYLAKEELSYETFKQAYENDFSLDDFLAYWEDIMYREFTQRAFGEGMLRIHKNALVWIKLFLSLKKKKHLLFSEISPAFATELDLFLINEQEKKGCKGNAARRKVQKSVKKFLGIAAREGKKFRNPYPYGNNIRETPKPRVWLTEAEIHKLMELYNTTDHLLMTESNRIALTNFLFMCFTGLRFSDMQAITLENIEEGVLKFLPEKTKEVKGEILILPLPQIAIRLLNDAKSFPEKYLKEGNNHYLLPRISNAGANRLLKRIAKMANISKEICTHSGRHTFATQFLENGGSVEVLKSLLGHSDIKTTMIYVHLTATRQKHQVMNAFAKWG